MSRRSTAPSGTEERDAAPRRVVYVTARLPYGGTEAFITPEIDALVELGCDVSVVPVRRAGAVVHSDARALLPRTVGAALLSGEIAAAAVAEALRRPAAALAALSALRASRNARILLKNLAVVPKALWLSRYARGTGTGHLHAHWAGTSATLAMLAARSAGVPWSFTAHRWDIAEDNLLRVKAESACFVRAISAHGAAELEAIVGEAASRPWVLHMGVRRVAVAGVSHDGEPPLRLVTAARFVEKKGHVHLVGAVELLARRGVPVRLELAGSGPLERSLRELVRERDVDDAVAFLGNVEHRELLRRLAEGRWHAMVLPSVATPTGELEGIPVALVEAMAAGLAVIGTRSGGTPELLADGAGIVVPPGDPVALADAIETLARDPELRAAVAERGRARVEREFSVAAIADALRARFRDCATAARVPA